MEEGELENISALRQMAEDELTQKVKGRRRHAVVTGSVPPPLNLSEADILKLYHELQVSQIELRMQNDELLLAKEKAEHEAEKFAELYDSAPSGYFTLSIGGKIVELNPSGAQMLGSECLLLKNNLFGTFVADDSLTIFHLFLGRVFNSQSKEVCEVILKINGHLFIDVTLTGIAKRDGEYCLVTMVDISELKRTERELVIANKELAFQYDEKAKRAAELIIANKKLLFENEEKEKRELDLVITNKMIAFQRDRLQKIASLVPGVVYQYKLYSDGSSCFPYSSEAIIQMYRVTPDEICTDAFGFFANVHPLDLEGFFSSIQESAKYLATWQYEYRVKFEDGTIRTHFGKGIPQIEEDGSVLWYGIISDITERRNMEDALNESKRQRMDILNNIQDVVWSLSWPDMTVKYISQSAEQVFGRPSQDFIANPFLWATMVHPDDKQISDRAFDQLLKDGSAVRECRIVRPDGTIVWINDRSKVIFDKNNSIIRLDGVARNITASRQAAIFQEIHHEILEILNEPGALIDIIQHLINILKIRCEFDAVGIRLQDGDDFPYFAQNGFSSDFLFTENTLTRTKEGGLCRDKKGDISLECTCGLVISGKTSPVNPLFTEWGSIWTNDSYPFLSISPDEDPRFHSRNVCIHQGFASVALIPIKNRDRNIGLIQFNDRHKDCFTSDMIERLEGIAAHIGEVLMRKQAEEELQKISVLLSSFLSHSPIFAFIKEVSATESRVLKASENYREMLGISGSEMAGKTMHELFPADLADSITADDWAVVCNGTVLEIEEVLNERIYYSIKYPITPGGENLLAGYSIDITERRALEKKLQESERQYRILVETSPEGIMIVQGARFMFVNQPMAEITGYSIEELMLMPNMDMVYPEDRNLVENNYRKRQKGEAVDSRYHFRIVKKDGSLAWIELNGRKTEWKGETAVLHFVSDITERKQVETVRQELEAKYSSMISNISEVIGIMGADGVIKYKSSNIEKWFGWQPQDLIGTDGWLTVHPDDLLRIQKVFFSLIEDDSLVKTVDYRYKCKDGSYKPIELTATNLIKDTVINGVLLNYRDITERKLVEERVNQLTTRLQLATRAGGVGVWDYDTVNNVLIWDDQMFALYGMDKKNFNGAYDAWLASVHPDDLKRGDMEIQMAIAGEREFDTQFKVVWPDGTVHIIRALAVVYRDNSGNHLHMIGTNWDITSLKRAEEEISLKNTELQKLNVEKDKFFSIIAHDLRSPFQTLLGLTPQTPETLLSYPLEKIQRLAINMRTSADKLFNLLENLLEWTQMQRNLISFDPVSILLAELIAEIVELIRETAEKKKIEICYEIPVSMIVIADKHMLESVVRNLVFNAVKFTNKEGKVIITAKEIPGNTVEISIKDTGIGMKKDMLDKLFRLDANISHTGTEGEPSTGLGLFICKDFVEKHDGKLWVESEEGKGSHFRFTLKTK